MFDEVFPFLNFIAGCPIEECQAAYDLLDTHSPGEQMENFTEEVLSCGSVQAYLEVCWPHIQTVLHKQPVARFHGLAKAAEYVLRRNAGA
jgi:hypothetical protein